MSSIQSAAMLASDPCERAPADREFPFSEADFRMLAKFAHEKAGIALSDAKRNLVYSRVSRRLRALDLRSFAAYREHLSSNAAESQHFINAISTNLTKFFRESHHFKHLRSNIALPFKDALAQNEAARLRIWSAGCSTGEEPYTIAAVLDQAVAGIARHDARILATDVDTDVLSVCARGEYGADALVDVPSAYRHIFSEKSRTSGKLRISDALRDLVRFRQLNLIDPWPISGKFDAIFCRNVMIYFDAPTKSRLLQRFAELLRIGGWLYIGHSESLIRPHALLELEGKTIYRRIA